MARVRFVSWKPAEAEAKAAVLRSLGYDVDASDVTSGTIRHLSREQVDAFVVDLDRLPSQGRDVGVAVRRAQASRATPLVFVGGAPDKVERAREILPDAFYGKWEEIGDLLARALASPPADLVVPDSNLAAYASTPLPRKLGIREGTVVCVLGAPRDFELRDLPAGVTVRSRGQRDLTMAFVGKPAEADAVWDRLAADERVDDVWIVWAKKASPRYTGVTQASVREPGMARGFVDFKVAAIDETWSGLRFKRRR